MVIVERTQSARYPKSQSSRLARRTAALDICNDIVFPECIGYFEGFEDIGTESL